MANSYILIAEDSEPLQAVYKRKLTLSHYEVKIANNGQEALDEIAKEAPALLLLDIDMPVLDGLTVLEKLPLNKRKFPVVLLTNYEDDSTVAKGKALGASDFLVKRKMTAQDLVTKVEELLK